MRFWKLHRSMPASGSSKTENFVPRASIMAISIRFSSPPDSDALTSRFTYSLAHSPTSDRYSQASPMESGFPAASVSRSRTVSPLKRTGCWKA